MTVPIVLCGKDSFQSSITVAFGGVRIGSTISLMGFTRIHVNT